MIRQLLGKVSTINPPRLGKIRAEDTCSFVPMEFVDDETGVINRHKECRVRDVKNGYTSFLENDVLFAKITPCMENGKCAIARNLINGVGFGSTEFHVLRAKEDTTAEWIYYYLRQEITRKKAERAMTGSAGQKRVPTRFLEEVLIYLPPLSEQKRIAAILEKADRLRRLRRYAHEMSNTYLQSVFLEMFGDPVTNPMGWAVVTLPEPKIAQITMGQSPPSSTYNSNGEGLPFFQGKTDFGDLYPTVRIFCSKPQKIAEPGDILISVRAPVGPTNINPYKSCIGRGLAAIRCLEEIDSKYLLHFLRHYEPELVRLGQGSTFEAISRGDLENIRIPLPPKPNQEKFRRVVQKTERLQSQQRAAERQAEHLFQTLLYKAFKGESGSST